MPIQKGKDSNGPFYRWGTRGKKYYYFTNAGNSTAKKLVQFMQINIS